MAHYPKILGIDPGSRILGFAVMGAKKQNPRTPRDWNVVDAGILKVTANISMPQRLTEIHNVFFELIQEMNPTVVAIEKAFHGENAGTAIKLGEARGALIAAIGRHQLPIVEITPAQVKKTVAGHGAAKKEQVYQALQILMGFEKGRLPHDASDALAIALTASLSLDFNLRHHQPTKVVKPQNSLAID